MVCRSPFIVISVIRPTVFQYGRQRVEGKDRSGKGTEETGGTDKAFTLLSASLARPMIALVELILRVS